MNKDYKVYLGDIIDAIAKIESFIVGMSPDTFKGDAKTQDAVIRNFEIIGEAVKRLPDEFKNRHPDISWRAASAMRDFLIHDYPDVIPDVIWKTATDDLPKFKGQITALLAL